MYPDYFIEYKRKTIANFKVPKLRKRILISAFEKITSDKKKHDNIMILWSLPDRFHTMNSLDPYTLYFSKLLVTVLNGMEIKGIIFHSSRTSNAAVRWFAIPPWLCLCALRGFKDDKGQTIFRISFDRTLVYLSLNAGFLTG